MPSSARWATLREHPQTPLGGGPLCDHGGNYYRLLIVDVARAVGFCPKISGGSRRIFGSRPSHRIWGDVRCLPKPPAGKIQSTLLWGAFACRGQLSLPSLLAWRAPLPANQSPSRILPSRPCRQNECANARPNAVRGRNRCFLFGHSAARAGYPRFFHAACTLRTLRASPSLRSRERASNAQAERGNYLRL